MLWFDVEKRYNTTSKLFKIILDLLWFDVEKRYNTTTRKAGQQIRGCGLM